MTPYYQDELVTLFCGDALEVMRARCAMTFDLIFTSPPYNLGTSTGGGFGHYAVDARMGSSGKGRRGGGGKWHGGALADGYSDYGDDMLTSDYEAWQRECILAMWDSLDDSGAIFYNHKPRPQRKLWHPRCLVPEGLSVRQEIIWARAGGINFAPTHYVPTYETILVIAKEAWRLKSKGASGVGDLWRITQSTGSEHPAPFPVDLPARAIETAGPSFVLDPFAGSGTTLVAAKRAGVRAVGIELSERYCEIAAERLGGPIRSDEGSLFEVPV